MLTVAACALDGVERFSKVLTAYSCLLVLRSFSMLVVPLDPPSGMLLLTDPFVSYFVEEHFVATRDLFFSGHTASLVFFFLIAKKGWLKAVHFALATFVIVEPTQMFFCSKSSWSSAFSEWQYWPAPRKSLWSPSAQWRDVSQQNFLRNRNTCSQWPTGQWQCETT